MSIPDSKESALTEENSQQSDLGSSSLTAESLAPSPRDAMQLALSALHTAVAGLEWYRDRCPDAVDGSDGEADDEIGAAIAALDGALTVPLAAAAELALRSDAINAELLEALKDVVSWVPGRQGWHTNAPVEAVERARAAIAKAQA